MYPLINLTALFTSDFPFSSISAEISSSSWAVIRWSSVSQQDPLEFEQNFALSKWWNRPYPSAIFAVVERAALIIWSPRRYRSYLGNEGITCLTTNKQSSRHACQQFKSSKVWMGMEGASHVIWAASRGKPLRGCCRLSVICCLLSVICYRLSVICCRLSVICYLLSVVCCLVFSFFW